MFKGVGDSVASKMFHGAPPMPPRLLGLGRPEGVLAGRCKTPLEVCASGVVLAATVLVFIPLFSASTAYSLPLFIEGSRLKRLWGVPQHQVQGLVLCPGTPGGLQTIPIQFQELDDDGLTQIFRAPTWTPTPLPSSSHSASPDPLVHGQVRLVFNTASGARCSDSGSNAVTASDSAMLLLRQWRGAHCRQQPGPKDSARGYSFRVVQKQDHGSRQVGPQIYLVACEALGSPVASLPAELSLDPKKKVVTTPLLRYTPNPRNHLLLQTLEVKTPQGFQSVLANSEFHALLKPRFFFPVHVTSDDFRSQLVSITLGNVALAGELSFFLRILGLNINLNLTSEVSLYRDAIHVPVVIHMPFDGSRLRPGSAVYYGFSQGDLPVLQTLTTNLPLLGSGDDLARDKVSSDSGDSRASPRLFFLKATPGEMVVTMCVRTPPPAVAAGFVPHFAGAEVLKNSDLPRGSTQFGVVYDVTKLPRGEHRLEAWFYLGQRAEEDLLTAAATGNLQVEGGPLPASNQ